MRRQYHRFVLTALFIWTNVLWATCKPPYELAGPSHDTVEKHGVLTEKEMAPQGLAKGHGSISAEGVASEGATVMAEGLKEIGPVATKSTLEKGKALEDELFGSIKLEFARRQFPDASAAAFGNIAYASFLCVVSSVFLGPMMWITFTARTLQMKSWYCGAHLAFAAFSSLSVLLINETTFGPTTLVLVPVIIAVMVGYFGYKSPEFTWYIILFWTSVILTILIANLVSVAKWNHDLVVPPARMGSGRIMVYSVILAGALTVVEGFYFDLTQSAISSIISAFVTVACASALSVPLLFATISPFDIITFFGTPVAFRYDSVPSVLFLGLFALFSCAGTCMQMIRSFQGLAVGFTSIYKAQGADSEAKETEVGLVSTVHGTDPWA